MARIEEWRYDFDGHPVGEKVARCSTRYELSEAERKSIAEIAEHLDSGRYSSRYTLETHLSYVSSLLGRLTSVKNDESALFPARRTLESQISGLFQLSRRLVALRSCEL